MPDGARAAGSDRQRREPGKHKHMRCKHSISAQPLKPVIILPGSKRSRLQLNTRATVL